MTIESIQYVCEHCKIASFSDKAQAEKHESKCAKSKKRRDLAIERKKTLDDGLSAIGRESFSVKDLTERTIVLIKEVYCINSFVFELGMNAHTGDGNEYRVGVKIQYKLGVKRKGYPYIGHEDDRLDASNILSMLGIHAGSGSGDGRIYNYGGYFNTDDFPALRHNILKFHLETIELARVESSVRNKVILELKQDLVFDTLSAELVDAREQLKKANDAYVSAVNNLKPSLIDASKKLEGLFSDIPTEHLVNPLTGRLVVNRTRHSLCVSDVIEPANYSLQSSV